jgi:hypothetical protein
MALRPPRKIQIKKPEDSERAISNVVASLARVYKSDIVDGTLVTDISVVVGSNEVSHKLGRQPIGWAVVDVQGAAVSLYRNSWDSRIINLESNAESTISLWVF